MLSNSPDDARHAGRTWRPGQGYRWPSCAKARDNPEHQDRDDADWQAGPIWLAPGFACDHLPRRGNRRGACRAGAEVVCTDILRERADTTAQNLTAKGLKARATMLDVTDSAAIDKLAVSLPPLDILVCNAGIAIKGSIQVEGRIVS